MRTIFKFTWKITVAEVAGIFITSAGTPVDTNGGTLQPNDTVNFDYTLTNIGNDATRFIIPNTASVTDPGAVTAVQYFDGSNYRSASIPGQTAVYEYDQPTASFIFTPTRSSNTSATVPVRINLAAGGTANYQVFVELPDNTPQLTAYEVPVTAFINFNSDGLIGFNDANGDLRYTPDEETSPANTTSDRVYTGFI